MTEPRFRAVETSTHLIDVVVNDTTIVAREGQSLAASLLSAGIDSFHHSIRLQQPRGPFCFMGSCFQCVATVDGRSNVRTCRVVVRAGMRVEIDEWPGKVRDD